MVTFALALSMAVQDPVGDAVRWLEGEAHRIIRASHRTMMDGTAAFPPQVGIGYEAFWLRDYAYALEGSIDAFSESELRAACRLFVRSLGPEGEGVDCVKFDGTPIYKPGYGAMGENPVADGGPFTVAVAYLTHQRLRDPKLLAEVLDPLVRTMRATPRNPKTGLVFIDPAKAWDRCPYGFTDTIRKQGEELFTSLLFIQSARRLGDLLREAKRTKEAENWLREADRVAQSARRVFWDPKVGLFRAATVKCREPDIWGSAFAVHLAVADTKQAAMIATTFKKEFAGVVQEGQIRHLPAGQYWEAGCARDEYQNGGFWATPSGWFAATIDRVDSALADRIVLDLVAHVRRYGACEWILGDKRVLPHYLASASLPLEGFRAMIARRKRPHARPMAIIGP